MKRVSQKSIKRGDQFSNSAAPRRPAIYRNETGPECKKRSTLAGRLKTKAANKNAP
jgi:hypothetical protein